MPPKRLLSFRLRLLILLQPKTEEAQKKEGKGKGGKQNHLVTQTRLPSRQEPPHFYQASTSSSP